MPNQPVYRSQGLDHLGLVAGMFDGLGIGDILDQAALHLTACHYPKLSLEHGKL